MVKKELFGEFLNDTNEVHALWLGFFTSFSQVLRHEMPVEFKETIQREYHYYTLGFWLGRGAQIVFAVVATRYGIGVVF